MIKNLNQIHNIASISRKFKGPPIVIIFSKGKSRKGHVMTGRFK